MTDDTHATAGAPLAAGPDSPVLSRSGNEAVAPDTAIEWWPHRPYLVPKFRQDLTASFVRHGEDAHASDSGLTAYYHAGTFDPATTPYTDFLAAGGVSFGAKFARDDPRASYLQASTRSGGYTVRGHPAHLTTGTMASGGEIIVAGWAEPTEGAWIRWKIVADPRAHPEAELRSILASLAEVRT